MKESERETHQYSDVEPSLLWEKLRDFEDAVQSRHYQVLLFSRLCAAPLCTHTGGHTGIKLSVCVCVDVHVCPRLLTVVVCQVEQDSDDGLHAVLHRLPHGGAVGVQLPAVALDHLLTPVQRSDREEATVWMKPADQEEALINGP